ncbi:MAG: T9SS type A sorting domain-containing protein, partial [Spirochaetes bacterium]|nr:T9SS type A sorting domain-containing protein [Spirochaetota bacterium]
NNHAALKLINSGTNNVFDITLLNSGGDPVVNPSSFANTVKVSLPFNDADHDLIVDETAGTPDALSVQTLKMFWLNTRINEWAIIDDSTVDLVNNFVMAEIDHLTLFIPISNPPYSDLKHVAVYPNPVYSPSKNNKIVFTKLTAKAKIRIYNIAGELVKDFEKMDQTDKWLWDGLNNNNDPVASGVYIFYIEDGRSEPARGKLAIIR